MGAVTIREMIEAERRAIRLGWTEEQLLDLAGRRLGFAIGRHFCGPHHAVGYLGKGHNAGDAVVALRVLHEEFGWEISTRSAFSPDGCSPLARKKLDEAKITSLPSPPAHHETRLPLVILDGLLGSGTTGEPRPPISDFILEINQLRLNAGATVVSVDLPSGINADSGECSECVVTADITFMIGNAKVGLLTHRASSTVGKLAVVPVEPLVTVGSSQLRVVSPQTLGIAKNPRPYDFHKGQAGRVAILAGSRSYSGAAILAAMGALHGGAGLITLFVFSDARDAILARCPPEIIIQQIEDPREILDQRFDALVVGCGLGKLPDATGEGLLELISSCEKPTVVDADALNLISALGKLDIFRPHHVITPHPGEFARLSPDLANLTREEAAVRFCEKCAATLLLKGSRTIISQKDEAVYCNPTGTPGMASGGQGDLLSGVIGALLAGGMCPLEAAMLGAWLCGRGSEIAENQRGLSLESLTASDTSHYLGAAFRDWKSGFR